MPPDYMSDRFSKGETICSCIWLGFNTFNVFKASTFGVFYEVKPFTFLPITIAAAGLLTKAFGVKSI